MSITAYFKFPSWTAMMEARGKLAGYDPINSGMSFVERWRPNHEPDVLEIDFINPGGRNPHPYDFPYHDDLRVLCNLTGALKVYRDFHEIYPRHVPP